ncbi:MAG: D-tyrosyl-tRNA(Tyr) deacylase [Planctomycetales bacterium]|nr:D-tyrosyl-tRNA(Tyr) deacylase [Planctomycetales bacterium]
MRACVQRVSQASVTVDGQIVGQINCGLLVLLGVEEGDNELAAKYLAEKTAGLRIFDDEAGRMNRCLQDVQGQMLVVSQFTLLGDCRKGRRPSFVRAAAPDLADALYRRFVQYVTAQGIEVATGQFRAHMDVALINDGPVTLLLDSAKQF